MSALFFVDEVFDNKILITGEDAKHISKSLRMTKGEELSVCDKNGFEYSCVIENISINCVECRIIKSERSKGEPDVRVTLYQALVKGDKMDLIVQKAVELGVSRIVPVITSRCISRPDPLKLEKKRIRLQKIADGAAMQSRRGKKVEVAKTLSLTDAVTDCNENQINAVFYEKGGAKIRDTISAAAKSIGIFVGSEGGFDESEIELLNKNGIVSLTLGSRILRTETAPIAALSIIMYITENI